MKDKNRSIFPKKGLLVGFKSMRAAMLFFIESHTFRKTALYLIGMVLRQPMKERMTIPVIEIEIMKSSPDGWRQSG